MQLAVLNSVQVSPPLAGFTREYKPAASSLRGECGRLCSECGSCASQKFLDGGESTGSAVVTSDALQD
jgi:hypothetical protein